jgi:hypothetical protein
MTNVVPSGIVNSRHKIRATTELFSLKQFLSSKTLALWERVKGEGPPAKTYLIPAFSHGDCVAIDKELTVKLLSQASVDREASGRGGGQR